MNPSPRPRRPSELGRTLTFAPLAWLKLQYFCHVGPTEIGGFGLTTPEDLLHIQEFHTVRQQTSPLSVCFDDAAVADYFEHCVDRGLQPAQFARIWLHTHPGASAAVASRGGTVGWAFPHQQNNS